MASVRNDPRIEDDQSTEPWHAERDAARRRRQRHRTHAAIVVVGWLLLAAFWVRAVSITDASVVTTIVTVIGAGIVGTLTITLVWIAHNLRIHRVKGPRTSVPAVEEDFTHDTVGRGLVAVWADVRAATELRIVADDDEKRYVVREVDGPTATAEPPVPLAGQGARR